MRQTDLLAALAVVAALKAERKVSRLRARLAALRAAAKRRTASMSSLAREAAAAASELRRSGRVLEAEVRAARALECNRLAAEGRLEQICGEISGIEKRVAALERGTTERRVDLQRLRTDLNLKDGRLKEIQSRFSFVVGTVTEPADVEW